MNSSGLNPKFLVEKLDISNHLCRCLCLAPLARSAKESHIKRCDSTAIDAPLPELSAATMLLMKLCKDIGCVVPIEMLQYQKLCVPCIQEALEKKPR